MKKRRIKTKILIIILGVLFSLLGLIARIDNNIISVSYTGTMFIITNILRKRYNIEV